VTPSLSQPRRAGGALLSLAAVALFAAHPSLFSRDALYPAVTAILFAGVAFSAWACRLAAEPLASGPRHSDSPLPPRLLPLPLLWTSGLFAFTILLSAWVNSGPAWDRIWVPAAQILYVWLGCWLAADKPVLARLGSVLLALASAAGVYALIQHLGLDPLPSGTNFKDRIVSVFDNPNHLGSCMAVSVPLVLHGFLTSAASKKGQTICLYGAVIAVYSGLLLAGSRGAWWGGLAGCGLLMAGYAISVRRGNLALRWRRLIVLGLSLGAVTFALSRTEMMKGPEGVAITMSARMRSSTNVVGPSAAKDSTVNHRYFMWQVAANMIREHPFVGLGYGSYHVQYPRFRDQLRQQPEFEQLSWLQQRYVPLHAHDEYLQRWAENGVFALLSLVALVGLGMAAALKSCWRGYGGLRLWAILGSMVAVLVHGLVSYPLHMAVSGSVFWILLGITYCPGQIGPIGDKSGENPVVPTDITGDNGTK
jgi:O-antigen ligase